MGQVIGQVLAGEHQVGRQAAVVGHLELHGFAQRGGRGHRLRDRADAADARGVDQGVTWVAAVQDLFEAAEQGGIDPGGLDAAVFDLDLHLEIALDTVEGTV